MRQDSEPKVGHLRMMMRRWRQRAWVGVGLAVLSTIGLVLCWRLAAHWFWWWLSGLGIMSALIEVFADLNAANDARKRIAQMEIE
jgi:hypothetical protein